MLPNGLLIGIIGPDIGIYRHAIPSTPNRPGTIQFAAMAGLTVETTEICFKIRVVARREILRIRTMTRELVLGARDHDKMVLVIELVGMCDLVPIVDPTSQKG